LLAQQQQLHMQQQQLFQSRDGRMDERSLYARTTLGGSAHLSNRSVVCALGASVFCVLNCWEFANSAFFFCFVDFHDAFDPLKPFQSFNQVSCTCLCTNLQRWCFRKRRQPKW
jgi:hypothetical protein